ncbi:MAG: hypothetical protein KJN94_07610 [Gammaproteobacteria bacterium]|nr:hypothetical protein [Gammaproteobacteria bacterium]
MRAIAIACLALLFSASAFAVAPANPSLEDVPDLDAWSVVDIGDISGSGWVLRGLDATHGDAFARIGFFGNTCNYCAAWGPGLQSSNFFAGAGEEITLDYRLWMGGGYCWIYNPASGDVGLGRAWLMEAGTDTPVELFFDESACEFEPMWQTASVIVPATGMYYILLQVGSEDATGGTVIGAELDVDNVLGNLPPDCSMAYADPGMLWPPNHKYFDVSILGVTDPDGDAFTLVVDSIFQDEPTNSDDDGDTCPDGMGVGTDTAAVRAERIGGEFGFEGNGRFYWIEFTATDDYGATCTETVKVSVPHDKKTPAVDNGDLFDSTTCP